MIKAAFKKYNLQFRRPAGTSRGILNTKDTWFIKIWDEEQPEIFGIGECSLFKGLSFDDRPEFESKLADLCKEVHKLNFWIENDLSEWPSIRFGVETAFYDLNTGGNRIIFDSGFTSGKNGIPTNGLVWMGDKEFMREQIDNKIIDGSRCIKIKIGAIDFDTEIKLIEGIRQKYTSKEVEIRVDANGAFNESNVFPVLKTLSRYDIHSIEQPIKQGQTEFMAQICRESPVPVALDEELIGIHDSINKQALLNKIKPAYIILKPGLLGGIGASREWISLAEQYKTGWWITSSLESNIGLNIIAQWTATLGNSMHQGLGTGRLFTNNITSPLFIKDNYLWFNPDLDWNFDSLF